jgi:NADH-quinone oxidoreductase subunit J
MTAQQVFFLLTALVTLASATMTVLARRIMHAAFWLVLTLFGVALLYALLEASFFAVVQVVVYIGAIAILFIFVVMLTRYAMQDVGTQLNANWGWTLLVSAGIFAFLMTALSKWDQFSALAAPLAGKGEDVAALGEALASPNGYLIPFEVSSVLLLAALVGSLYIASERKGRKQ